MYNTLKNYLNIHKKGALTLFVIALFAVGALLLGQAGYLGGSGSNLTGALINTRPSIAKVMPAKGKKLPVASTGTLYVKQSPTGSVVLIDPTPAKTSISVDSFNNPSAIPGNYSLGRIDPPVGYALASVKNAVGKTLSAPYAQTLAANGTVGYSVSYELIPVAVPTAPASVASGLTASKSPGLTTVLINGENDLIGFSLTADNAGSVNVSRIDFATSGNVTPNTYKLYRGATLLMTSMTPSFALPMTETIAAGTSQSYKISALVTNRLVDSYLVTTIEMGGIVADQPVTGLPISHEIGERSSNPVPPAAETTPQTNVPPATPSILTVSKAPGFSTALINGENSLIGLNITADNAGSGTFTALSFSVNGDVAASSYTLYRGATRIMDSSTPSFTLPQSETISAGTTQTYILRGVVSGAVMVNSSLTTVLDSAGITTLDAVTGTPIQHTLTR